MKKQKVNHEIYLIFLLALILLLVRIFAASDEEERRMCLEIIYTVKYEDKALGEHCDKKERTVSSEHFEKMSSSISQAISVGFETSLGFEGFEVSKSVDISHSWSKANSKELRDSSYIQTKEEKCVKYNEKYRQLLKIFTTEFKIEQTLKGKKYRSSVASYTDTKYKQAVNEKVCLNPDQGRLVLMAKQDIEYMAKSRSFSKNVSLSGTTESYSLKEKKCGKDRKYFI